MRRATRAAVAVAVGVAITTATFQPAVAAGTRYTWLSCNDLPPTTGYLDGIRPGTYYRGCLGLRRT
jgi:hypothetical protein